MKRELVLLVCLLMLLPFPVLNVGVSPVEVEASNGDPVHNLDTGLNYTSIQEAINANETLNGHTVFVEAGTYHEHVIVNKSLNMLGENINTTIITGDGSGTIVQIDADNTALCNFSITDGLTGVDVNSASNSTIQGNNITRTETAIKLTGSPWQHACNNTISDNIIINNTSGIRIAYAQNNTLSGNTILQSEQGIYASDESSLNNFTDNTVNNSFLGFILGLSPKNILRGNTFNNSQFNFIASSFFAVILGVAEQDIDTSNKVNGKSIYYLVNQTNQVIDNDTYPEAGHVTLIDCTNITVRNLAFSNNGEGAILSESVNCTIESCSLRENMQGVLSIGHNSGNSIVNSDVSDNYHGITMSGYFNAIMNNTITNNTLRSLPYRWPDKWPAVGTYMSQWITNYISHSSAGIWLQFADNSTICWNNVTSNENGIVQYFCSFNTIKNNHMANNIHNFGFEPGFVPKEWQFNFPDSPEISRLLQHEIDESNTVDGKPVYYWKSKHNQTIPSDAGYVALINCTDIILEDLVLSDNCQGAMLIWTNNTIISNCTITENQIGIDLRANWGPSCNNTIAGNRLINNGLGIHCAYGSINCTFLDNDLASNLIGIYEGAYETNLIAENLIMNHTVPPTSELVLGKYYPHESFTFTKLRSDLGTFLYDILAVYLEGKQTTVIGNDFRNNSVALKVGSDYGRQHAQLNTACSNNFSDNIYGVFLTAPNNTISYNNLINNWCSISLVGSSDNRISGNSLLNNTEGIRLYQSSDNEISRNSLINNFEGIGLGESFDNSIFENTAKSNYFGISLAQSSDNRVFHNNLINNTYHCVTDSENILDNGYPSGGNYWSNYTGADANNDGIGDAPHIIIANSTDNYPLIGMFSNFNATSEHQVQTICNSTISGFQHNGTAIRFDVTGENGSAGFCRICIPTALMNDTYQVFVNGTETAYEMLPVSNSTHSYLYFAYEHSTKEVVIIPEFPSLLLLPLFMFASLMVVLLYKRKRVKVFTESVKVLK